MNCDIARKVILDAVRGTYDPPRDMECRSRDDALYAYYRRHDACPLLRLTYRRSRRPRATERSGTA